MMMEEITTITMASGGGRVRRQRSVATSFFLASGPSSS